MANYHPVMPNHEGQQHLLAAAHHILKALGTTENLSDDMKKLLADLDVHLSIMTGNTGGNGGEHIEVEARIKCAKRKILNWESNQRRIWDAGPREVSEYLGAVDEVQKLIESLGSLSVNENGKLRKLLCQADNILQVAMSRLKEELIHILVQHKQYFEPEYVSFHSCQQDVVYEESFVSLEDESIEAAPRRVSVGFVSGEYIMDLIHPCVIPDLKAIANAMFAANYNQEFCEAFICARKDALNEYLLLLELETFSIEDVLQMKWSTLSCEIKKWNWAMKIIIRIYLASEKQLCNKILGGFETVSSFCFVEIARASLLHLLNFGEAIAMGSIQPEKLFRLLDMYEVLDDLLIDTDSLLFEEVGSYIRIEFHELLRKLGQSASQTFSQLRNAIVSNTSMKPLPRGGVHPLTRYIMNYITTLTIYDETLNLLLEDQTMESANSVVESEIEQEINSITFCPLACHLRTITSVLECNLVNKSRLYKEDSLQYFFLMNNIHYMVQKIKNSDLRLFFGDEWIRKHNGKFQQHATSYQRATWCSVLSFLRDDGQASNSVLKATFKERCRDFTNAFEDVYKHQTLWSIPDPQLKDDVRISTSLKVIHAYRSFIGRNHINDRHIKYTADDLENLLLDFFEGLQRSLRNSQRR